MRLLVLGHNDWWVWHGSGFCGRNAALVLELADGTEVTSGRRGRHASLPAALHRPAEARDEDVTRVAAVDARGPLELPAAAAGDRYAGRQAQRGASRRGRARPSLALAARARPAVVLGRRPASRGRRAGRASRSAGVDAIDDWRFHPWAGAAAVEAGYELAGLRADVVFGVTASSASGSASATGPVLFNAVDRSAGGRRRPDADGFAGGPARSGLRGCCRSALTLGSALPPWRALAGGRLRGAGPVRRHAARSGRGLPANVHLVGAAGTTRLPGWLLAMDACIMPHRHDGLTASMDPLKLYEYLAAGRPVVSTVQSPNPALQAPCAVSRAADEFAAPWGGAERRRRGAAGGAACGDRRADLAAARRPRAGA